jgi:hypothetical protein
MNKTATKRISADVSDDIKAGSKVRLMDGMGHSVEKPVWTVIEVSPDGDKIVVKKGKESKTVELDAVGDIKTGNGWASKELKELEKTSECKSESGWEVVATSNFSDLSENILMTGLTKKQAKALAKRLTTKTCWKYGKALDSSWKVSVRLARKSTPKVKGDVFFLEYEDGTTRDIWPYGDLEQAKAAKKHWEKTHKEEK